MHSVVPTVPSHPIQFPQMTHIGNIEVNGVLRGVYILKTNIATGDSIDLPLSRTDSKKCLDAIDLLIKSLSHENQKNLLSIDSQGLNVTVGGYSQTHNWEYESREFSSWRSFMKILNPHSDDREILAELCAGGST
jgi:hypothetical protein